MNGESTTSGKAIGSLVCGIIGFFICGLILGIVAIVLGKQAMGEIDTSGGAIGGRGLALAGIIMGVIDLVAWAIIVLIQIVALTAGA